jgi:protein-S-isoprenylcysteine O-methyltransferase Ste14
MTDPTWVFIQCCWAAWSVYWLVMAFATKRTVERGGFIGYRLVAGIVILGLLAAGRLLHLSSHSQLWQTPVGLGVVTDCIVLAGAAFTVWARITLGRNWSAEVTFKQDHELIESGPYALARHPIYTGLIIMAFGTAINYGRAIGFGLFVALCAGLWWKARQEERIMSRHYPDAYAEYKAHVSGVIPFVL